MVGGGATCVAGSERAGAEMLSMFGRLDTTIGSADVWAFGTSIEALPRDALWEPGRRTTATGIEISGRRGMEAAMTGLQEDSP
ncbi:hypothetical protein [Pseudonocardia acidicola]|uniref:Uncharacterized protein n=1 Tax=Pseudonocardia acidicola TaxID=2724939 RepID=A0ABX1S743_9PSEU|nr:hypothetical protein [Pseudonocardia acidicola]NMH97356.1 hypothetical protein [Pseudonocardia acidicola]